MYGTVDSLKTTFGFIRGDDGVSRFFIPSYMEDPLAFDELRVGQRVRFEHADHAKGPRAAAVAVVVESAGAASDADAAAVDE